MELNNHLYTKSGEETLKQKLIEQFAQQCSDPLTLYAALHTLSNAAKAACQEKSQSGIDFALKNCQPEAGEGKNFSYNNLTFGIQYTNRYNYLANDSKGRPYSKCLQKIAALDEKRKSLIKLKTALEAQIRDEHPQLKPTNDSTVVLKFIAAK